MSVEHYRDIAGNYLGQYNDAPTGGIVVASGPVRSGAIWNGSSWDEPTINYTTCTKKKARDLAVAMAFWAQLKAFLQADEDRWDNWLISQNLDIADPDVLAARDALAWTQQQLQDFFNQANA